MRTRAVTITPTTLGLVALSVPANAQVSAALTPDAKDAFEGI
jgi:hypothetical protein